MSDPLLLISADCHAGLDPASYREFLDPGHREALASYCAWSDAARGSGRADTSRYDPTSSDVDRYAANLEWRLEALAGRGFAAEVIFPDDSDGRAIPFSQPAGARAVWSPEQEMAGARAYNRWLGSGISPARQVGVGVVPMWQPQEACKELTELASLGLKGVLPTIDRLGEDRKLYDREWDAFWDRCEDLGFVVHFHIGTGLPREHLRLRSSQDRQQFALEASFWTRRLLWQVVLGGVLERHPGLRTVFVETGTDWVARTADYLDWLWEKPTDRAPTAVRTDCPERPSTYVRRQCIVTASSPSEAEMQAIDSSPMAAMIGMDFPHAGSVWEGTSAYLGRLVRAAVGGVAVTRALFGLTACDVYGLDDSYLSTISHQIGPTLEHLDRHAVDDELTRPAERALSRPPRA